MGDESGMNNAIENSNLIDKQDENNIFCSNISRWVSNMSETLYKCPLAECGIVSYKLIGECHLPPRSFPFVEFLQDEDALRIINSAKEPGINNIERGKKYHTEEEEEIMTRPALIDKLSVNCLIKIFSHLPPSERLIVEDVCIHWRNVSKKSWCNIQELQVCCFQPISFSTRFTDFKFVEKLLRRCGVYLKTLKIHFVCTSHILPVIGEYCHNLETIHLSLTDSNDEHFDALSKMKKLQSFTLITRVSSECLLNCLLNLPKTIQSININGSLGFDDNVKLLVKNIFEEFTELKSLTLEEFISDKDLMEVISRKITIIELCVIFIGYEVDVNLLTKLSNLERLELRRARHVDDDFLRCISTKCQKLKYLDVSWCQNFSDEGVRELRNLNNLEVLLINQTDISDLPLGQLKGIKKLDCQNCWKVKDDGIMQLMKNCPDLEELDVVGTSISKETLLFAIRKTKDRKNGIILTLTADLKNLEFDYQSENYSPFLKINGPRYFFCLFHLKCEHDDYEYEKYENYRRLL